MAKKRTVRRRKRQRQVDRAHRTGDRAGGRQGRPGAGRPDPWRRRRGAHDVSRAVWRPCRNTRSPANRSCRADALPAGPVKPHVARLMNVIETLGRFLDPIVDGPAGRCLLDAQREPPAAGDAQIGAKSVIALRGAGSGCGVQDPRAQYREGTQPQGEVARDNPHAARPGRRPAAARLRTSFPLRVRPAGLS